MQTASQAYKAEMKKQLRDRSYIRVTIGLINQEAQASASVPYLERYTYYSNLGMPLNNYQVEELYAACDQDYSQVDGSMYFLPRRAEDVVLNQGIVSESLLGPVELRFPLPYDIRGLTIEFGKAWPVNFRIESDQSTVEVKGNASGHFVTEEIFDNTTWLRIVPETMVNGQGRLRIHQITMGIGIYFDNHKILSATKKEHVSPIMEELPTLDFDLTVNNKDRTFDIENEDSAVNFLEIGQEIRVLYGQELENGDTEWIPGATVYLREWSADDERMSFSASDRFEDLDGTYYQGTYRPEGITLYNQAVDVLEDAGVDSRTYWLDGYLRDVTVNNPLPPVPHREALQMIANAGRCILYQDRNGKICMKSSFIPDMEARADAETYFSSAASVLEKTRKEAYAMTGRNFTDVKPAQFFLPREGGDTGWIQTGYVSEAVAGENGRFQENPQVEIVLEARYKCFGLTMVFGRNPPGEVVFRSYLDGDLAEEYTVSEINGVTVISHEFPDFDRLVLEFTKGAPFNRVVLNQVEFGESTDYELSYGTELTRTPKGTQLARVRELQVLRTLYSPSAEESKELTRETVEITSADNRYTFYFSNASYEFSCAITDAGAGQTARIVDSSSYYATVEFSGISGSCEVVITGKEYAVSQAKISRQTGLQGSLEVWENPLVSSPIHAADLADWVGDYLKADREYDLEYRGDPRIDTNDLVFLENKYVPDLLVRVYDHTLKFNGALAGTIKARRDMSGVAAAKNRLERK